MYEEGFLTDDEIERLVYEQTEANGSATEDDVALMVKELNGSIISAYLVDAWRGGYMRAHVRDGEVAFSLTEFGAEQFDRMRNEDR